MEDISYLPPIINLSSQRSENRSRDSKFCEMACVCVRVARQCCNRLLHDLATDRADKLVRHLQSQSTSQNLKYMPALDGCNRKRPYQQNTPGHRMTFAFKMINVLITNDGICIQNDEFGMNVCGGDC